VVVGLVVVGVVVVVVGVAVAPPFDPYHYPFKYW